MRQTTLPKLAGDLLNQDREMLGMIAGLITGPSSKGALQEERMQEDVLYQCKGLSRLRFGNTSSW